MLAIATQNVLKNDDEFKSGQGSLLRKSSSVPFPVAPNLEAGIVVSTHDAFGLVFGYHQPTKSKCGYLVESSQSFPVFHRYSSFKRIVVANYCTAQRILI